MSINNIGFGDWFKEKIDHSKLTQYNIARILSVQRDAYIIGDGRNEISAQISGKIMYNADSPLHYPGVGDWVYAHYLDNGSFAVIEELFERKSVLFRKTAGKKIEFQLIAANIDYALIMQSLDANFNLRRLERYLAMVNEAGIHPLVLLSKSDLISAGALSEKITEIHKIFPDLQLFAFSNLSSSGLDKISDKLFAGNTYCLLGSSGVGKTTLLNRLMGEEKYKTAAIREKDGRGRHTTSRRQLIRLANGAMIIDTPGMRELGNFQIDDGITDTFPEIFQLAETCYFNDCTHNSEKGCAVQDALEHGLLSRERFENYLKLKKESAHYKMSYAEKRKKDKEFGKLYKSIMKNKVKK